MECPKCHGEMKLISRVSEDVRSLEKPRHQCACSYAIDVETGVGYRPDQKSEAEDGKK